MLPVGDPRVHGIVIREATDFADTKHEMPRQYPTGTAGRSTVRARTTDTVGLGVLRETYLDETRGWVDRIESLVERYPWPTLLLAFAVGYAISRRVR